jgi:NAD(P)-dependent dehydrogenase (short-subunit alcohol dehydrogenase family)
MSNRFDGRVAVITGGASGMGLATARRWVADGGRAVIGDIADEGLAKVAAELGDDAATLRCDVTSESDQEALVQLALERFGSVDAAVACPAIGSVSAIVNMPVDEWRRTIDVTLTGVMITIKQAGRVMSDGGAMVAIASINASVPGHGMGPYNAAKAGVVMLAQIAALELAPRRIRVNTVAPGLISTGMTTGMLQMPEMLDEWAENTPLVRYGEADEVGALICWLLSSEAAYITGESVIIDGGTHLRRFPDFTKQFGVPLDPQ